MEVEVFGIEAGEQHVDDDGDVDLVRGWPVGVWPLVVALAGFEEVFDTGFRDDRRGSMTDRSVADGLWGHADGVRNGRLMGGGLIPSPMR